MRRNLQDKALNEHPSIDFATQGQTAHVTKLDVGSVDVGVRMTSFGEDDTGAIPDKLAELTLTVLALHKANGDLAWVIEMAAEAENADYGVTRTPV